MLLSGTLLPLALAPLWLRTVADYNPFNWAVDRPARAVRRPPGDPPRLAEHRHRSAGSGGRRVDLVGPPVRALGPVAGEGTWTMIKTKGLAKSLQDQQRQEGDQRRGGQAASTWTSREGEIFGFLGPERRRQDHHAADARHPLSPDDGEATVAGATCAPSPRRSAAHRLRGAGRRHLRRRDRPRGDRAAGPDVRHRQGRARSSAPRRSRRSSSTEFADRKCKTLLRWPAPPRRHRDRASSTGRRCCSWTSRPRPGPAEPRPHVGRDPPAARRGHDGLHHHALPRRGRRALRPHRDHRPRRDRRRGHPDELKREISGDVVTVGVADEAERGRRGCSARSPSPTASRSARTTSCGSTSTPATRRSRRSCGPWRAPGSSWRRSGCTARPWTTSSSPRPDVPCATDRPVYAEGATRAGRALCVCLRAAARRGSRPGTPASWS